MLENHLTTAEVAAMANISTIRVAKLCQHGKLEAVKIGRQWWIPKEAVAEDAPFWHRKPGRPRKEE